MHGLTKFTALSVTSVAVAVALVVALTWLGPDDDGVDAAAFPALFDEGLVQEVYAQVSPAVAVVRAGVESGGALVPVAYGSAFLIDREGHLATNYHVVGGSDHVVLDFQDGTSAQAQVLGGNPGNDLALLKVDPALVAHIEPVELGDSALARPGQMAIAIGSPFGLGGSVSVGVISGTGRVLGSDIARPIHGILQTDALTNPGESGGPLLDREGRVMGINAAVRMDAVEGGNQVGVRPVGFAFPVNTLVRLLSRLKEGQVIPPTFLGAVAVPVGPLTARQLDLPAKAGVYVTQVLAGSPAHRAGLVPAGAPLDGGTAAGGDLIVAVDGFPVDSLSGFFAEVDRHLPGDRVVFSVLRAGDEDETEVIATLDRWPAEGNPFVGSPRLPLEPPENAPAPRYPLVPEVPGFRFPDLYPVSPQR